MNLISVYDINSYGKDYSRHIPTYLLQKWTAVPLEITMARIKS